MSAPPREIPRLALSPDEAAAALGVSRDYLDEHVAPDLAGFAAVGASSSRSPNSSAGSRSRRRAHWISSSPAAVLVPLG